jgi:predicted HTH transcriptional regulator
MRLRGKLVGKIEAEDILGLVENKAPESRVLEYKRELPGRTDDEKKEFLADVTAFANTAGGVIVYGVETEKDAGIQDTGIPRSVVGVVVENQDKEQLRLGSLLHDGLDPSLVSQVALQWIAAPGVGRVILLVGVAQSLIGPHRIKYQNSGKIWRRSESGKYQPDFAEMCRMFIEP